VNIDMDIKTLEICYCLENARQRIILVLRRFYFADSELYQALKSIEEAMKIVGCKE